MQSEKEMIKRCDSGCRDFKRILERLIKTNK